MGISINRNKTIIFVFTLFLTLAILVLYAPSFSAYFFQDDWFSLLISRAQSVPDFLKFFLPRSDVIYYRPLGMQVPFFLVQKIFGIQPLPFRIATHILHVLSAVFVYKILRDIFPRRELALSGAFLYATSSVFLTIYFWAATFAFIMGPLLYLSAFWYYSREKIWFGLCLFLLGLLTNEILVTLPFTLLVWKWFFHKKALNNLTSYISIVILYGVMRWVGRLPTTEAYKLTFNLVEITKNFRNYLLWAINWPENIKDQFSAFVRLQPKFVTDFAPFVKILITGSFIFLVILCLPLCLNVLLRKIQRTDFIRITFGMCWFGITILPVLFFSHHAYSYYLPVPLVGMIIAIVGLLDMYRNFIKNKLTWFMALIFVCGLWYYMSYQTTAFNLATHWAPDRAKRSAAIIGKITAKFPKLPAHAVVLVDSFDQYKWALGDQTAMRLIYGDDTIVTFYGTRDEYLKQHSETKEPLYDVQIFDIR